MKAIILSAGMGTRMRPLTLLKPKSLLTVGGMTVFERTVNYLHQSGIQDITLVVGYMADCFIPLAERYGITMVVSPYFETHNNSSSLRLVKDTLEDCLIVDGDLVFQRNVLHMIQPGVSQFIAQKIEQIPEWQCIVDENNRIIDVKLWSSHGYAMSGLSYWTGHAAQLLAAELEYCAPDDYWEHAAVRILRKTPVYMTPCPKFQIELDGLYDALKLSVLTPDEVAIQCSDSGYVQKLKGLTNDTYHVDMRGVSTVLRIPGRDTEKIINRELEQHILSCLAHTDIVPQSTFFDSGIKTMPFLEGYGQLQCSDIGYYLPRLCDRLRELHAFEKPAHCLLKINSVEDEINLYERLCNGTVFDEHEQNTIRMFAKIMDNDKKSLCHRDLLLENILVANGDVKLIDFEYASYTSLYWDIASFITESRIDIDQQKQFAKEYGGLDFQRVMQATIVVDYIWSLWGIVKKYNAYARKRICALDHTLSLYEDMYSNFPSIM